MCINGTLKFEECDISQHLQNEPTMMDSSEDQNYLRVYFLSESISIVNNVFSCLLQRPK